MGRVAAVLAAGFEDDPAWGHLLRDPAVRPTRLRRFFEAELAHLPAGHQTWIACGRGGGIDAAAVWAEPGRWRAPLAATLRSAPEMARVFGRRLALAARSLAVLERRHARSEREHAGGAGHWYLHYLCAAPESQGLGLGSALVARLSEACDEDGLPAFVEASTERSAALYERNGYARTAEFQLPGRGPWQRQMWRLPPRPRSSVAASRR